MRNLTLRAAMSGPLRLQGALPRAAMSSLQERRETREMSAVVLHGQLSPLGKSPRPQYTPHLLHKACIIDCACLCIHNTPIPQTSRVRHVPPLPISTHRAVVRALRRRSGEELGVNGLGSRQPLLLTALHGAAGRIASIRLGGCAQGLAKVQRAPALLLGPPASLPFHHSMMATTTSTGTAVHTSSGIQVAA